MGDDPIACRADSRSAVTESFRALRTNLQYLLAKEDANVVLVSSLHPQEGKSFVSANLASILAKAGKNVALVDFDMHKPRVHTYMGLANESGASSLMIGKAKLSDVLKPGAYPSLDVLTAGPIPPNASDLILSDRMKSTIAELKAKYDYVILDTPPILLISDALVLMEHVDTAMLVTNVGKSSRRGVQHLEDLLEQNGLKHASFVLNGVKTKRWAYYYNRYAAKYGYATLRRRVWIRLRIRQRRALQGGRKRLIGSPSLKGSGHPHPHVSNTLMTLRAFGDRAIPLSLTSRSVST